MAQHFQDLAYAQMGQRTLLLDLNTPDTPQRRWPIVVWIEGGGWANGGKRRPSVFSAVKDGLLAGGCAIASLTYRPNSEVVFPAQIAECKAAVRWLRAQARHYHLDPDRIGAWGFSSGGYLAALLGATGTDDDVLVEGSNHLDCSSGVRAVCTYAAPAELRKQQEAMTNELLAFHAPLPEGLLTSITADCPPFLIIHGEQDRFVPSHQAYLLHNALQKANAEATLYLVPGGKHGLGGLLPAKQDKIVAMIKAFFDRYLSGEKQYV